MVGPLAAFVSQHLRRNFNHLAGGAALPRRGGSYGGGCRKHGRIGEYWQSGGASLLGVGFRFDHQTRYILLDVRCPDFVVLVSSKHRHCLVPDGCHLRGVDVLRRRVWHHAGVYRRLLWSEECRSHLRPDADGVGLCQRVWSPTHRAHARNRWFISRRAASHRWCHDNLSGVTDPGASTAGSRRGNNRNSFAPFHTRCSRSAILNLTLEKNSMIKVKQLCYALLLGGIAITAAYSQDTATEYVAPPDAGPKGKAPRMKVQLLNPGEKTKQYAVIFYQGDEAF